MAEINAYTTTERIAKLVLEIPGTVLKPAVL